ncbi:putative phosducin, thioredoxin-like domain, Thioredoxin-like superfamily [Helianthus anomalus]
MGDYHFVYKDVEGSSTQWDDIQRKLGNLPPKPPAFKPDPFTPAQDEPKNKNWIDHKTQEELEDLEDDFDNDQFYQEHRRQKLAEMKQGVKIAKFGSIIPISRSNFVHEVSQASSDVWVVVVLYKDGYPECSVLMQCVKELATTYPATKFVQIVSTDCIPNHPDCYLPTVFVYNNGAVKASYVGLHKFGRRCTPEGVAVVLCQSDPVLNDGQSGGEGSREAVLEGVSKRFIEEVVTLHDNDDDADGSASD